MLFRSTPDAARIHIVLVEDDLDFAAALQAAIGTAPDLKLVASAPTKAQALKTLESPSADVLLVDLGLPDGSGIDVIAAARAAWPSCAIMVCTTFGDENHVIRSIEAGANGYLLKDSAPQAMTDEIRSLHGGGSPISPLIARQVLMCFRQQPGLSRPASDPAPAAACRRSGSATGGRSAGASICATRCRPGSLSSPKPRFWASASFHSWSGSHGPGNRCICCAS